MTEKEIAEARDKFLGKRIKVRNVSYRETLHTVTGTCTFLGINEFFPKKGLQVTVNRLPVWGIRLEDISLDDGKRT